MPIVRVLQPLLEELHKHPPPAGSVGQLRDGARELYGDGRERGPRVEFRVPRARDEGPGPPRRGHEIDATA